ncbi:HEPN domain-containing protein [Microcoleus sp. herbarium8]|uniref:HEPN domain-containing protein n=1 Tax=Microcoleus sp. herbarium8 TaxID=3055436 RepID=UPI002FD195B0
MSFDWSQYLNLAKELAGRSTIPAEQEARLRDAISRSYYAAFILARNYLRDEQGHSLPKTSDVHQYVWQQFDINPDSRYQLVANNLKVLRRYRNQADYDDNFPLLSASASIAIKRCQEIISTLSSL